jgi:hypothetical protein
MWWIYTSELLQEKQEVKQDRAAEYQLFIV